MRDIATAQLSGNLTRDVDLRALPSGADVARLRVAFTTRRRHGEEWIEKTSYVTVDVFGAQARACAQHLVKGSRVFLDAELDWHEWSTQDGQHREALTLKARHVLFEGSRPQNSATANGEAGNGTSTASPTSQPAPPPRTPIAASAPHAATSAPAPPGTASADDLPF